MSKSHKWALKTEPTDTHRDAPTQGRESSDSSAENEDPRGDVGPDTSGGCAGQNKPAEESSTGDGKNTDGLAADGSGAIDNTFQAAEEPALHVGDHVLDRDEDEEDQTTMVVVATPATLAEDYVLGEGPETVADYNDDYPAIDPVIEIVYPQRTDPDLETLKRYAFPRGRLELEQPVHDRDDQERALRADGSGDADGLLEAATELRQLADGLELLIDEGDHRLANAKPAQQPGGAE